MTLALLIPNDYRHAPVLMREPYPPHGIFWTGEPDELDRVSRAIYSFRTEGGIVLHLHRDDDTKPGPRRAP